MTDTRKPLPKFVHPTGLAPSAWFLGPKGENRATLTRLVATAIEDHLTARDAYAPDDPDMVSPDARRDPAVAETEAALVANLGALTAALRGSIPLASWRNQSHMYWDISLPGAVGYFAAMLWNQNNVAAEASPVTTALEIEVGLQLCTMLGYGAEPEPWGHITCDGSVANAEALWAARNLRFQPAALAKAIREEPELAAAARMSVVTAQGQRVRLLDLDGWSLMNITPHEALNLPKRVAEAGGLDEGLVRRAMDRWSVQTLGLVEAHTLLRGGKGPATPAILVPATAHYSWAKGAALLGLGKGAVRLIAVDADGRMSMPGLRAALDDCLDAQRPVLAVVAVMGTTEEGAVDPLAEILAIRAEYGAMGMGFSVHADAAWGGYFAAMLRPPMRNAPPDAQGTAFDATPEMAMSDHVQRHFTVLGQADSITVDPHKAGFMPYPAGALCYRDARMRHTVAHTAPVVWHDGKVPGVGVFGIEGSKPGAAAAGVALSHATIPPDASGFGRVLSRCIFNAKRLHAELVALARPDDPFLIVPFNRLPSERNGGSPDDIAAEQARIARDIAGWSNAELVHHLNRDPDLMALFRALGPDLTVTSYAVNLRLDEGPNRDQAIMNEVNETIYRTLSLEDSHPGEIPTVPMFVTSSVLDGAGSAAMIDSLAGRAGIVPVRGMGLRFLISTVQNPWLTDTARGNFLPELMSVLRETATRAAQDVAHRHGARLWR